MLCRAAVFFLNLLHTGKLMILAQVPEVCTESVHAAAKCLVG